MDTVTGAGGAAPASGPGPPSGPPSLEPATIRRIARRATGDLRFTPTRWEWERLRETAAYVTAGVYRLRGRGHAGAGRARPARGAPAGAGGDEPWSAVLKILRLPGGLADERRARLCTPSHPDYWRREALVYRSRVLRGLPRGLGAPRCFAVEERGDGTVWLWLEDVVDAYRGADGVGAWPFPDRFLLAARLWGAQTRFAVGKSSSVG
jgi:hypothetical protein